MAIVKCQNPQCDYFQKPVPEGDYCPFCGEPLPTKPSSTPQSPTPPTQPKVVFGQVPIAPPPIPTPVVNPPLVQPSIAQPPIPTPPVNPPVVQPPIAQPPIPTPPVNPPVVQPPIAPQSFPFPLPDEGTVCEGTPFPYPTLKLIHTSGQEFLVIAGQKAYIGRRGGQKKPYPEIDLTDIPYSERVSRPHAHIFWDEQANHYMIVDNQSTNGTIINGEFLKPWLPYRLDDGSTLELGKEHCIKFTVQIR